MNKKLLGFNDTIILLCEYSYIASGSSYQMNIDLFAESSISNLPYGVRLTLMSQEALFSKLTKGVLYSDLKSFLCGSSHILTPRIKPCSFLKLVLKIWKS